MNGRNEKCASSPFSAHELLDRRLLVGEQVRRGERAAAQRAEVLRRANAAAHDHEVRRHALGDEDLGRRDELRPALLAADEPGEADGDAVLRQPEARLAGRPFASDAAARRELWTIVSGSRIGKRSATSRSIAIAASPQRSISAAIARLPVVPSLAGERRAQVPDDLRAVRCATCAAARSGESLRWTIGKRCSRISRSSWRRCGGSAATSRPSTSQRRPS